MCPDWFSKLFFHIKNVLIPSSITEVISINFSNNFLFNNVIIFEQSYLFYRLTGPNTIKH